MDERNSRRRWVLLLVLVGVLLIPVAYFGYPIVLGLLFGDPAREGLRIENRTAETVFIYDRFADGSEHPFAPAPTIPPHSAVETSERCAAGQLVARTRDEDVLARRGPYEECNLEDWIIPAA